MEHSGICIFCDILFQREESRVIANTKRFFMIYDLHPVDKGHALVIPKRHVSDFFFFDYSEWGNLPIALKLAKHIIDEKFNPAGYNIGINCGEFAGQTVMHAHIHVIPCYTGDDRNKRGGIRNFKTPLVPY